MASRIRSAVWSPVDVPKRMEEPCGAVVPHGESGLQMRQRDGGAAVENSVDGAEAQNLSFGPAGSGAVEAGTDLAQGGVAFAPEVSRLIVAGKAHAPCIVRPIESAAQFGGDCG